MVETEEEQQQDTSYAQAIFSISPQRLVSLGRSLQMLLLHRRCATCWVKLVQDPDGGRNIKVPVHLKQIAKQCSTTQNFIHSDMPLAEAIFRVLLANGNKPMTTEEVYGVLNERWVDPINPRIPALEGVYKILATDAFYGIAEEVPEGS